MIESEESGGILGFDQCLSREATADEKIRHYRSTLQDGCIRFLVIDDLFNEVMLSKVFDTLSLSEHWVRQRHTYSQLYVDDLAWSEASEQQRFVQRDSWLPSESSALAEDVYASEFSRFLRSDEFLVLLSSIFNRTLTDKNVRHPSLNTNYFRLGENDFIGEHADQSSGREVCLLLYLNKNWRPRNGGELCFRGDGDQPIKILPKFNRSVLFDPSSPGSEHWVERSANQSQSSEYRYNVTSWYWRE